MRKITMQTRWMMRELLAWLLIIAFAVLVGLMSLFSLLLYMNVMGGFVRLASGANPFQP